MIGEEKHEKKERDIDGERERIVSLMVKVKISVTLACSNKLIIFEF